MKPDVSFNVEFDYSLTENITIHLTANVQLLHSEPHYLITDFRFKNNPSGKPLLDDLNIVAVRKNNEIMWVHADSKKETMLSNSIGKAIEEKGSPEISG